MNNLPNGTDVVAAIDAAEFTLIGLTTVECEKLAAIVLALGCTDVAYGDIPGFDDEDVQGMVGRGISQDDANMLFELVHQSTKS